jgi:hypothetical protein
MREALAGNRIVAEEVFRDPAKRDTAAQTARAEQWAREVVGKSDARSSV